VSIPRLYLSDNANATEWDGGDGRTGNWELVTGNKIERSWERHLAYA